MRLAARILAFLCGLYASAALAAYQPAAIVQIPTVAALQAGNFTNTPYLNLANYATVGDGGGGTFVPCTGPCTVDNGVVFQDSVGNKFLRQFTGPVLMPWYGIKDGTSSTCIANYAACDATAAVASAMTASLLYGNGVVSCAGLAVVINSGNLYIPPNQGLDCGQPTSGFINQRNNSSAYWSLPNSIVLNPAYTIYADTKTWRTNLNVRPTWYGNFRPITCYTSGTNGIPTTVHDEQCERRLFTGTGTTGAGEASNLSNAFIVGFDTGMSQSGSADTVTDHVISDNSVDMFLWGQRGGYFVHDMRAKTAFTGRNTDPISGVRIDLVQWGVTAAGDDGTGQIQLTVNNAFKTSSICPTFATCMQAGYTVGVSNLAQFNNRSNVTGQVTNGSDPTDCGTMPTSFCITNVPAAVNNGTDGINSIQGGPGTVILDGGSAGCNFTGIYPVSIDPDMGIVWLSGAPSGCSPSPTSTTEPLTFVSSSGGPAGADSFWLAGAVTTGPDTVVLVGSSYAGPTYTGVKWTAGSNAVKVYDTTNIYTGQFVCSSGTAPFCTPPTAFSASTTTTTALNNTTTGSLQVVSTLHWPQQGIVKTSDNCSASGAPEWMAYTLVPNANGIGYLIDHINIQARGVDGTTNCAHPGTITLTPSAPQVIQTIPEPQSTAPSIVLATVLISSTAQTTEGSGQNVHFANDNTQTTGLSGQLVLNANYQTWSGNLHAGSGPYGSLVTKGDTNSSNLLTNVVNTFKIQPGMTVDDANGDIPNSATVSTTGSWTAFTNTLTVASGSNIYRGMTAAGTGIPAGTLVSDISGTTVTLSRRVASTQPGGTPVTFTGTVVTAVSGTTVTINATATGSHATQFLSFAGCGYPSGQPWLGNCKGTSYQVGSLTDASNQGAKFVNIQSFGKQVAMSIYNSPALSGANLDFANGSGVGAQIDPESFGYDFEGAANDGIRITNSAVTARTGIYVDATTNNNDTIGLDNVSLGTNGGLMFALAGTGGTINLHALSGHGGSQGYIGPSLQLLTLADIQLSGTTIYYDSSASLTSVTLACINNFFLNSVCGQSQTFTPTGANTATTLPNFAVRSLSLLDFGGIPDWGVTDNTAALAAAETAALAQNVHVIRMDCAAVGCAYSIGTHTVPAGIQLVCPGPLADPVDVNGDFRHFPNSIVLSTTNGMTFGNGAGEDHCNFFTPTIYTSAPPPDYQTKWALKTAFAGTGLTCTDYCSFDNSTIVGFATGIKFNGVRSGKFDNDTIDATTCLYIHSQRSGGPIDGENDTCYSVATPFATPEVLITGLSDNGSGLLHATFANCTGGNCPKDGYGFSVINPGSTESAVGFWTATNTTATSVDLLGSTSAFLTGYGQTATTTSGSIMVTGLTTNLSQIQVGQSIADGASCIPASTTIVAIWRSYGIAYMSAPATCTHTATITITDSAPSTSTISAVTLNSPGTGCYSLNDILTLVGGTFTDAAQIQVDSTDQSCSSTSGVIQTYEITDGGTYTVLPGPTNVATTGGGGTGATFNISSGAQIVLYGSTRTGPAIDDFRTLSVNINSFNEFDHLTGLLIDSSHNFDISHCRLSDENFIQDATHIGISLQNLAAQNNINCGSYYFGTAFLDQTIFPSGQGLNTIRMAGLGGSVANSGPQNTLFRIESPTPGTAKRTTTNLTETFFIGAGVGFVADDSLGVTFIGNQMAKTTVYGQSAATSAIGSANTFAAGSIPVYTASTAGQLAPSVQNASAGAYFLANNSPTFTEGVNGSTIIDAVALTNNRNLTLSNTGATGGFIVTVSRHGSSGGFNRVVKQADGTTTIATLADGAVATFYFNSNTNLWVQL
jgi:hypothetical protein